MRHWVLGHAHVHHQEVICMDFPSACVACQLPPVSIPTLSTDLLLKHSNQADLLLSTVSVALLMHEEFFLDYYLVKYRWDQPEGILMVTACHLGLPLQVVQSEVDRRKLEALQHRLRVLSPDKQERAARSIEHAKQLLSSLTSEKVGFLQTFNSWRQGRPHGTLLVSATEQCTYLAALLLPTCLVAAQADAPFLGSCSFVPVPRPDGNTYQAPWTSLCPLYGIYDSKLIQELGMYCILKLSHRTCTTVSEIANRLAPYAAGLLGCKRVRLYQDCAFLKASH